MKKQRRKRIHAENKGRRCKNNNGWISAFECLGLLVVISLVSVGILFAIQIKNLILLLLAATAVFVAGFAAISALIVIADMAKDLSAIKRMLSKKQDMPVRPVRHRRSAGHKPTREKGIL